MKKIKDLIYDYNDIFLALLIIAAAAAIIFWRVTDIMAYPKYLSAKEPAQQSANVDFSDVDLTQQNVEEFNTNPGSVDSQTGEAQQGETAQQPEETGEPREGTGAAAITTEDVTITIPSGSAGSTIAQILVDAKVISTKDAFLNMVEEMGVAGRLKAGTFTIPAGSDLAEIIEIITR